MENAIILAPTTPGRYTAAIRDAAKARAEYEYPAEWCRAARDACGLDRRDSCPVVRVAGNSAPRVCGRSYHWTTPGGKPVRYPSAYSRAFGRPVYHASTRRVIVGRDWRPAQSRRDAEIG